MFLKKQNILETVLIFILFYYSSLFQLIPIYLFNIKRATPSLNVLLSAFSGCIMVLILYFIYRNDLKKEWKIFKNNSGEIMNTTFGYWFIGMVIMLVSNTLIIYFTGSKGAQNEQLVQGMITAMPLVMLVNAGFFAPFNEELIFRKTIRKVFDNKWVYVLLSGLIFGALHVIGSDKSIVDWLYIIPYASLGCAFALSYYETKTIYSTIFMHMIHNTVLVGLSIILKFLI